MTQHEANDVFAALLERVQEELQVLPDKPDETPAANLCALWALATGRALALSQLNGFVPGWLEPDAEARLLDLVERRLAGVPLAHLTGRQDFMGQVLLASPAALVPRRETEQLGYAAVDRLRTLAVDDLLVVDVCTGAGNVALGIACHVEHAQVFGADLCEHAIGLARENARFIGRHDVEFRAGDLLNPFDEARFHQAVDVLTCNPPYISSMRVETLHHEISQHEPRLAFDGGPFGVGIVRRFIKEAPHYLKPGGWLLMEIGAGQGASVAKSIAGNPRYDQVNTYSDANGEIRVVEARRATQPGD
jgi:release factor glutamine methyltransferase